MQVMHKVNGQPLLQNLLSHSQPAGVLGKFCIAVAYVGPLVVACVGCSNHYECYTQQAATTIEI
jgi:hypothetical protein